MTDKSAGGGLYETRVRIRKYKPVSLFKKLKWLHINTANGVYVFRIIVLEMEYFCMHDFTYLKKKKKKNML